MANGYGEADRGVKWRAARPTSFALAIRQINRAAVDIGPFSSLDRGGRVVGRHRK